jgi:hypothetical protein
MRNIRLYFDSDGGTIGYLIDLENKRVVVGNIGPDGTFTEVVQDEPYVTPSTIQRQITNLIAIELNRKA